MQVYIKSIELRYLWLDAGLKGPGVPNHRKAGKLHRKYRKRIVKYRNTVGLQKSIELRYLCLNAGLKRPGVPKYRTAAHLHRKYGKSVTQSIEILQVYIKHIEFRYVWLDAGLKGPRAPKYLQRKHRKCIAKYRNTQVYINRIE